MDGGRQAALRREDRGVTRPASPRSDDAQHQVRGKHGGFRGSQVLGHHDARFRELGNPRNRAAQENGLRPHPDVAQVSDPLGEISAEGLELLRIAGDRGLQRMSGAGVAVEVLFDGLDQPRVAGDHGGGGNHFRGVPFQFCRLGVEIIRDDGQAIRNPRQVLLWIRRAGFGRGQGLGRPDDGHRADGAAGGDSDSGQGAHGAGHPFAS